MTSEHISRDWTGHRQETHRSYHEYCGVEIFSYDHDLTKTYQLNNYHFKGTNFKKVAHRHLSCLESKNETDNFILEMDYNCKEKGYYRVDILYENKNGKDWWGRYAMTLAEEAQSYKKIKNTTKPKVVKTAKKSSTSAVKKAAAKSSKATKKNTGSILDDPNIELKIRDFIIDEVPPERRLIDGRTLLFDGEPHHLKRKTVFPALTKKGKYKLILEMPKHCFFVGVIIRKVKKYRGDNQDTAGSNLMLKECEVSVTEMTEPSEATFEIGYSQFFDCDKSRSGFYMDYMDEVNVYYRVDDTMKGKIIRRFGGYISTIKLDDDRTTLSFSCGSRLQDGDAKFIMDSLLILHGTTSVSESEYYKPINFNNYGKVLKYLCSLYETTLDNNISKNYLVAGEHYSTGLSLKFGEKKNIKKVKTTNAKAFIHDNFITMRNRANGKKPQRWVLYNAEDHAKKPIILKDSKRNYLTFHLTYGLGATKKTDSVKRVETIDVSESTAGAQKWTKCGVSEDGKYVMGIGTISSAKDKGKYGTYYKTIFKNKCPYCGKAELRWDSCRSDTHCITGNGNTGTKRNFPVSPVETEITCNACDLDLSVLGNEKDSPWRKLTKVTETKVSSKAEQDKLHRGEMVAVPKTGEAISEKEIFNAITKLAFQYRYKLEGDTCSSYSCMQKAGHGECWAFSDLISHELTRYKINHRIMEYPTSQSGAHRSVQYKNSKGKWANFPYREYGWNTKYNNNLNDTSGVWGGKVVHQYSAGGNMGTSTVTTKKTTKTQTTTINFTKGYDKDKPIQGYFKITYSTKQSFSAKTKSIYLNFTQKSKSNSAIGGLQCIWINNATRKTSVDLKGWFADNEPNKNIYLHTIEFITPKITPTSTDKNTDWFKYDDTNHDHSSCMMDLYQIIWDNEMALNPTDLQACGKSIGDMITEITNTAGYRAKMIYGEHRRDDKIYFSIDNQTEPAFYATEGDDNNILEWNNITYTPVSDLRNKSTCVFKQSNGKYAYVDTANLTSILNYGEKTTLQTKSDEIGSKEAYFNARSSTEYNPTQQYTYTIVVPFAPNLHIGDLVSVVSNSRKLNDVKPVKSLKIIYKNSEMPRIRTEIGLGEIEPFLRIKKRQEKLRKQARSNKTYFGRTATPVDDEDIYIWDN